MSGLVLAITSGKGGVGKSTTALNLGVSLGASGESVVLVDADLGMANIGGMLDIHTDPTLHDVLAGQADVESTIVEEHEAVDVVPGGRNLKQYAEADPDRLPGVLDTLAEQYEYVVVDAGAGLGYADVVPVEAADEVILTTTPGDPAIGDTAKLAKFSERVDAEVRGVVVTNVDEETDAEVVATKVGTEPLGVIPRDSNVDESIEAELPLEQYAPDSPAGVAYSRLAGVIAGRSEAYIGDAVTFHGDTKDSDTGSVSDPFEDTEDRNTGSVSDPLKEAGDGDRGSVPDPFEDTEERDPGSVPDPLEDAGGRNTGGVPGSPEEAVPASENADASPGINRTSDGDDLPEIGETPDEDDPLESRGNAAGSAADENSDGETGGGLLARLRNLL